MNKGSSKPFRLWVIAEHRSATFVINFRLPIDCQRRQSLIDLRSWAADEIDDKPWEEVENLFDEVLSMDRPDAVILSRYAGPHGRNLLSLFRRCAIRTYFHLDDFLDGLPQDLGASYSRTYSDTFLTEMNECMRAAGGVLVSTERLQQEILARKPLASVQVLQGVCFPGQPGWSVLDIKARLARLRRRVKKSNFVIVGYMGTRSHQRDLNTVIDELAVLMRADNRVHFETFGLPTPESLRQEFPSRVRSFGFSADYADFLRALYELDWDVGIAPLVRDRFNQCKTITKFVEYSSAGIPTVAEDVDPYSTLPKHVVTLARPGAWAEQVAELLQSPRRRIAQLAAARRHCAEHYSPAEAQRRLLSTFQN